MSSTSCASSVSLRAYFAGDTVEDLFPGVEIGKVNLPKKNRHVMEGYPEGVNLSFPLADPTKWQQETYPLPSLKFLQFHEVFQKE